MYKKLKILVMSLLMLFAFSITPIAAQPAQPKPCAVPIGAEIKKLQSKFGDLMVLMFSEHEAVFMVAAYNAMDPKSTFEADQVFIITAPSQPVTIIALANEGCVVDSSSGPDHYVRAFISLARRRAGRET